MNRGAQRGFTIVELLIVVVIIAILASISVVAYNGIQNRSYNAAIESDVASIVKKLEMTKVTLGRYPSSTSEFPADFKIAKAVYKVDGVHNMMYCLNKSTDRYGLAIISKSGIGYLIVAGVVQKGATATYVEACNAVGSTWVNDATTTALHGYNYTTGLWYSGWGWTA